MDSKCDEFVRFKDRDFPLENDQRVSHPGECVNYYRAEGPEGGFDPSGFINYRDGGCVHYAECPEPWFVPTEDGLSEGWEIWQYKCPTDPPTDEPTFDPSMCKPPPVI